MRLKAGSRLGSFEIVAALGAGGMGEVYRARDSKLNREVALKVLPEKFALDPDRLARFRREAQVLASLNHRHIAHVYGIEETVTEGVTAPLSALVMELVEGPTLADRLATGPLPVVDALRVAINIAEGLEAAHDKGIVHRDLKPANIKLAPGGVKILDFGLAKAMGESEPAGDVTHSPTLAAPATHAGVILGTAAYMSPEQAEGRLVDKRADVWAFGTVLFEMLSGRRAFDGKSVSHVIVHVLEQEPDWKLLPPATPDVVRELLERCLQKDPARRPRDIGDLRLQLEAVVKQLESGRSSVQSLPSATSPQRRRMRWLWPVAAAIAIAVVVLVWVFALPTEERAAPEAVRFEIAQPGNVNLSGSLSVSPDGRNLAFIGRNADGIRQIWIRTLNALEARPLSGTEGADGVPFWSPDGRSLAFSARESLKKIDVLGGSAQTLCQLTGSALSGFWAPDGTIVFGTNSGTGIQRVAAAGGVPAAITKTVGVTTDGFPTLLPDGRHFLFSRLGLTTDVNAGIFVSSLEGQSGASPPKRLLADSSPIAYAATTDAAIGYVLFAHGNPWFNSGDSGPIVAQRLDTKRLELLGEPIVVVDSFTGAAFSVSRNDVLVYGAAFVPLANTGGAVAGQLTWFDRQGHVLGTIDDPGLYMSVELSPDDSQAAFMRADQTGNVDIWVADLARGNTRRLTFDAGLDAFPIWSPDGRRIAYATTRGQQLDLYLKASNGEGEETPLLTSKESKITLSWSRDSRFLLYATGPAAQTDLWALPMDGANPAKPVPILTSMFRELGFFSPDSRWISYISSESGRSEIYIRPFDAASPASGGKFMVSKDGGANTRWRADGKELFYYTEAGEMMAVDVTTTPSFRAGVPRRLFKGPSLLYWAVSRDGQRFLMPVPLGANSPSQASYRVVLNWTSTLR